MQTIEIFKDHFCILDTDKKFYSAAKRNKEFGFNLLIKFGKKPTRASFLINKLNNLLDMESEDEEIDAINERIIEMILRLENIKELLHLVRNPCLN